ncbi:MAG: hypothetical protein LKE46_00085 [Clostridium sp.]|jgi:hypothetical protein|uniref:hypothetical protein n=1 Tax=Clostridium sp. TaxID=1506 RepID=UPI0025BEA84E|nr:hypothetical protein [Clostridium sp.]MCH3962665.1 hypothetical protein [Clostridium sp.]MCI2201050.1 hypothetical protein [Clostridium sp.]
MEQNHVVIDLDTFSNLQKEADELEKLKKENLILPKDVFTMKRDFRDKVNLAINGTIALNIARELLSNSEFKDSHIEDFEEKDIEDRLLEIGEFSLIFINKNEKTEKAEEDE